MNRDLWLPAFGIAFVVIAIAVLLGLCRNVTADQQPLPTRTPTVEPTASPTMIPPASITAVVIVPTSASSPVPTSTLTPLPTATATQERRASEFSTPVATATKPAPPVQVPAPAQVPRRSQP